MGARDTDGIELGHFLSTKGHHIAGEAQSRIDRKQPGATGNVFFERIVLQGAAQLLRRYPLLFPDRHVHGQNRSRGGIDGKIRAHLVQGNAFEETLHIRQRVNRHSHPANFVPHRGVVRIKADLGGQIQGHTQPGHALL